MIIRRVFLIVFLTPSAFLPDNRTPVQCILYFTHCVIANRHRKKSNRWTSGITLIVFVVAKRLFLSREKGVFIILAIRN